MNDILTKLQAVIILLETKYADYRSITLRSHPDFQYKKIVSIDYNSQNIKTNEMFTILINGFFLYHILTKLLQVQKHFLAPFHVCIMPNFFLKKSFRNWHNPPPPPGWEKFPNNIILILLNMICSLLLD